MFRDSLTAKFVTAHFPVSGLAFNQVTIGGHFISRLEETFVEVRSFHGGSDVSKGKVD